MDKFSDIDRRQRLFPPLHGVPQKVTLKSNVTGVFKQIAFVDGVENEINGNIADDLLIRYPNTFTIVKVNGATYTKDQNNFKDIVKKELLAELKNNFDIIPKKTDNKRDRLEEEKLLSGKEDKVYSKDNLIPDNAVKEEKIVESKTKKYTKVE
ncbi:MAG TPA: hypothetical protein PKN54_04730 [Candidatus Cloacimonas acidaminovorans]|jgi:hypothetical protein|nr:hypothetical protein [Clostridia bacterium]HNV62237.1 hypothetical protein [Candidatus Cloacimonas acidaminovorans]